MKWISICLSLLLLASFPYSQSGWFEESCGQVWRQTDWSGWPGVIEDTNTFHGQRDTDWWSSPGDLKLSHWIDIWIGSRVWHQDSMSTHGVNCLLELPNGDLLAGGWGDRSPGWRVSGGGVFRSTDRGESWTQLETGFEDAEGVASMIFTKGQSIWVSVLYKGGYFKWYSEVWKSDDYGSTWEKVGGLDEFGLTWSPIELVEVGGDILALECDGDLEEHPLLTWEYDEEGWLLRASSPEFVCDFEPLDVADTIYLMGCIDGFLRSTDGCYTWKKLLGPLDGESFSLTKRVNGVYYAAADYGYFFKTRDFQQWEQIPSHPPFDTIMYGRVDPIFQSSSGILYAGGWYTSNGTASYVLLSLTDEKEWRIENIYRGIAWFMNCYFEDSQGNVFIGLQGNPWTSAMLYKKTPELSYTRKGLLSSYKFDTGQSSSWGRIDWDATLNGGEIKVFVRTNTDPPRDDCLDWLDYENWVSCFSYAAKGRDISNLPYVHDGDRYITYIVQLYPPDPPTATPILHEIRIEYGKYTEVEEEEVVAQEAVESELFQNQPNPFSQSTAISYQLSVPSRVRLRIYDASGRVVRSLVDEVREAGLHRISWDGRDETGKCIPAGIYFCRLETTNFTATQKLVVVR